MKKIIFIVLMIFPYIGFACSSCNVEYSDAEKKAFFIATSMLIVLPFTLFFFLYRYIKKNY